MDLLNIPGDTGLTWRLEKFGEFAHKVRVVDQLTLEAYCTNHKLNLGDCVRLFWLLSSTYSEVTAIALFEDITNNIGWKNLTKETIFEYWTAHKSELEFGSARKYAKSMDWFPHLISDFMEFTDNNPDKWLESFLHLEPSESYLRLYKFLNTVKFMGRFSIELFLMNFTYFYLDGILNIDIHENTTFNWIDYSNETSGLLNIFYQDELANKFDKNKELSADTVKFLNKVNNIVHTYLLDTYGKYDAQYLVYMPRICTFRNFCKQHRYAGFHHDRQLGFINKYLSTQYKESVQQIFDIRKSIFPHELLGELNGWSGIRPERKKLFVTQGLTGAEIIQ